MDQKTGKEIIKQIKEQYNVIALDWDKSRFKPSILKVKLIKEVRAKDKILDLGCGNGLLVPEFIKKDAFYTGVDISKELIKIARKKYPNTIFKVGDVTKKLPFKDKSLDWVFSFAVMHHLPNKKVRVKFLQEIKRVLKVGGKAIIVNWNLFNELNSKRYNVTEKITESGDMFVPWYGTVGKDIRRYLHVFKSEEIKNLVKLAGFKNCRVVYYDQDGEKKSNGEELVLFLKK